MTGLGSPNYFNDFDSRYRPNADIATYVISAYEDRVLRMIVHTAG
jgi:hypothetical protein